MRSDAGKKADRPESARRKGWRAIRRITAALFALLIVLLVASTDWLASLGAQASGERLARMQRSPNYRDGRFQNRLPTSVMLPGAYWKTLRLQFTGDEDRVPPAPLPVLALSARDFAQPPRSGLRATWLGHSTVLVEIDGHRLLFDPIWGTRASPSTMVGPARFQQAPLALEDLPPLDAVIVSHDHYDHLDMETVRRLARSETQRKLRFVLPLGIGAHLERWGVPTARITELEWGESTMVGALRVSSTQSRHFSGRFIRRDRTLWSTWSIAGPVHRVFHSGDTGFFEGFAEIGRDHGPFDLTMIKIGSYGPTWPDIHVDPEQAVRAHQLLRGKLLLPIHWATFNLAYHDWFEPPERAMAAASASDVRIIIPRLGQPVEPVAPPQQETWWRMATGSAKM